MARRKGCDGSPYHRYRRFSNENGKMLWKCIDCPSFTYNPKHLIGNKARCYICGETFKITPESLTYAKVKCGVTTAECKEKLVAETVELAGAAPSIKDLIKLAYEDKTDPSPARSLRDVEREIVAKAIRSDSEQDSGTMLESMMKEGESK